MVRSALLAPCMALLLTTITVQHQTCAAIKVRVWTNVTAPDFTWPEVDPASDFGIASLELRPSLGIALSGGGLRAAALAYGWLRTLHMVRVIYLLLLRNLCIHMVGCEHARVRWP